MRQSSVNKITVLILVALISLVFAVMIRGYLMTLLLAGVFSALSQPLFRRILKKTGERRTLSSALTMVIFLLIIIIPLLLILSIVVAQAVQVGQTVKPWIQQSVSRPDHLLSLLKGLPFYHYLVTYQGTILTKLGELVSGVSSFLVNGISRFTSSTVHALFLFFIFLYALFFFIRDGGRLINLILYYLPLEDEPERKLLDHFTSVTRATLKGTFLIGLIQGTLAGTAFALVGIRSVVFWGLLMTVLSIIPLVGSSLVWFPAVIYLLLSGHTVRALILLIFCAVLVGSIDNVLRPVLVGKDTKMHELLILLGTLGGIALFGIWGVLIGPVIAALFVSIWDLYGRTFSDYLPEVVSAGVIPEIPDEKSDDSVNDGLIDASLFISAVEGSTGKMEKMTEKESLIWKNGFLQQIRESILMYSGVPVKYTGDGVLAYFSGPNHQERAILSSIAAKKIVEENLRIGLHSGPVYFTSSDLSGKAVNKVFRILSAQSGTGINASLKLTSEAGFKDVINVREEKLKGFDDPVEICEIPV